MSTLSDTAEISQRRFGTIYSRFLVFSIGSLLLIGALGYIPTARSVGQAASGLLATALLVAWVASLVGTIPIYLARGKEPLEAMPAQFGAMALRLMVILLLGVAVAQIGWFATKPFMIWLVIGHIALLASDTYLARSMIIDPRKTKEALEER